MIRNIPIQVVNDTVILRPKCTVCGEQFKLRVNIEDFEKWQNGELAQIAFPYLPADHRELLISGMCPNCWNEAFGDMDEIWHK